MTTPCRVPLSQCSHQGMCLYHHTPTQEYTHHTLHEAALHMKWSSYYYLRGLTAANGRALYRPPVVVTVFSETHT